MKPTTKTIISGISTLMVVGMISSLVNGSETYFVGREQSKRPRTASAVQYGQASVLLSDVGEAQNVSNVAIETDDAQSENAPTDEQQNDYDQSVVPESDYSATEEITTEQVDTEEVAPESNEDVENINEDYEQSPVTIEESSDIAAPPIIYAKRKRPQQVSEPVYSSTQEPTYAPVSCEDQGLYSYLGDDNDGLLYGTCIPCEMNKFNVQTKTCSE